MIGKIITLISIVGLAVSMYMIIRLPAKPQWTSRHNFSLYLGILSMLLGAVGSILWRIHL